MAKKKPDRITPGEVLLEEFLKPMGISQNKLGRDLGVPITRINEIVHGKRAITVDTAMRLARYFGTSPEVWMNLQQRYDLEIARQELWPELEKTIHPLASTLIS
jgi:addiction module HigA family antidote